MLGRKPFKGSVTANLATHGTGALNVDACRLESGPVVLDGGAPGFTADKGWNGNSMTRPASREVVGRWPANVLLDDEAVALLDEQTGKLASDSGGASRFYYVAKPSREERDFGCHCGRNGHPTVKPIELMRWLVRLVTPPGGTVLDPFLGSGTTGMACRYELREFVGIEREAEYIQIAERRIAAVAPLFAESGGIAPAPEA